MRWWDSYGNGAILDGDGEGGGRDSGRFSFSSNPDGKALKFALYGLSPSLTAALSKKMEEGEGEGENLIWTFLSFSPPPSFLFLLS